MEVFYIIEAFSLLQNKGVNTTLINLKFWDVHYYTVELLAHIFIPTGTSAQTVWY